MYEKQETTVIALSKRKKASFHIQINEQERLTFASFEEKGDPSGETIVGQLQRRTGDKWETAGTIELYRAPGGTYKQLPESK